MWLFFQLAFSPSESLHCYRQFLLLPSLAEAFLMIGITVDHRYFLLRLCLLWFPLYKVSLEHMNKYSCAFLEFIIGILGEDLL